MIESDRVNREKEWHNETFGTDVRAGVDKFYSIFPLLQNEMNTLIENIVKETSIVLEYGCGNGYYLINFSSRIKKGIGIDISEALINHAKATIKEKSIENLEFMVMDAMNTTFENGYFNVIHGQSILHHLSLEKSLVEIKRLLNVDGIAYFAEPLDTNFLIKLYRKLTPKARTVDEQPLRAKDIKLIKSLFPRVEIKYYFCFSLLAVPFREKKIFKKMLRILNYVDKIILNKKSPFKWLAWFCTMELKNIK